MAHTFASELVEASWNRRARIDGLLCHVCGKLPKLSFQRKIEHPGIEIAICCEDRHGIIKTVSKDDWLERPVHGLIERWNESQQEARNAAMFPGKPK